MKPIKQNFFNEIAKQFDSHVRQSIPVYDEFITALRANLVRWSFERPTSIIDICGSTGKLGYDLFTEGFKGSYTNLDGSPQMVEISRGFESQYPQMKSVLGGFMASWIDDSGTEINEVNPLSINGGKKYDVALELLGFQFFTQTRLPAIKEMKRIAEVNIYCEKFSDCNSLRWQAHELLKDQFHKSKYFTEEQIKQKRENVLQDMGEYCYDYKEFRHLLDSEYQYVLPIYHAGNFAAYICSDSPLPAWNAPRSLTSNIFTVTA